MLKIVGTFSIICTKDSSGIIYNRNFGDYLQKATLSFLSYD